jgi:hypothetical protein
VNGNHKLLILLTKVQTLLYLLVKTKGWNCNWIIVQSSSLGFFATSSSLLVWIYFEVRFESCLGTLKKSSSPLVSVDFDVKEAERSLKACKVQITREEAYINYKHIANISCLLNILWLQFTKKSTGDHNI